MKSNFENLDVDGKADDKNQEIYKGFMQFRKKGYWNEESEQAKKVKKFLRKMRKQRQKMSEQHEKNIKKS